MNKNFRLLGTAIAIALKGTVLGIAKLAASIFLDPVTVVLEKLEQKRCPEGRAALVIVDAQKDFTCAGTLEINGKTVEYADGRLGVPGGYEIVPHINTLITKLKPGNHVAASQDYHPADHGSFGSNVGVKITEKYLLNGATQTAWPDHCVQGTEGADFLPGLLTDKIKYVVKKGLDITVDSYSAFADNTGLNETALDEKLKSLNVKRLYVVGIATNFCVGDTALGGKSREYDVTVIEEGCRAVPDKYSPPDRYLERTIENMRNSGIKYVKIEEVLKNNDFIQPEAEA